MTQQPLLILTGQLTCLDHPEITEDDLSVYIWDQKNREEILSWNKYVIIESAVSTILMMENLKNINKNSAITEDIVQLFANSLFLKESYNPIKPSNKTINISKQNTKILINELSNVNNINQAEKFWTTFKDLNVCLNINSKRLILALLNYRLFLKNLNSFDPEGYFTTDFNSKVKQLKNKED